MSGFKVGDKVLCVSSDGMDKLIIGKTYTVSWVGVADLSVKEVPKWTHYIRRFELVKEKNMFDMKQEKWFIRTQTPEISEAVQLWLFEQGFVWQSGENKAQYTDTKNVMLSDYAPNGPRFAWSTSVSEDAGYKEIKLTFKTTVDTVEYPSTETQAQKDLKELEQQIVKLSEQAAKLKESMK